MNNISTHTETTNVATKQPAYFEMKPFAVTHQGTKISFLDVWGDPPAQPRENSAQTSAPGQSNAGVSNRRSSRLRATLINWGLILE